MTHGWPGSVIELLEVVGPLTDPTAHGGRAEDAFHLVLPSVPGYGFSGEPAELGWNPVRTALAWAELMQRLGYARYVAQGGDVGAAITDAMGHVGPQGLVAYPHQLARDRAGRPRSTPRTPTRRKLRPRRSPTSGQPASATSSSRPRVRRRSATPCWIHRSRWRPGCSTTTPTATRRSRTRSSTRSQPAISPATTSSTTSRRTGSPVPARRRPVVLGEWTTPSAISRPSTAAGHDSGWLLAVPRRNLPGAAQLGRAGVPDPQLLQQSGPGRPLRRVGRAADLLRGDAGHVRPVAIAHKRSRSGDDAGGAQRVDFGVRAVQFGLQHLGRVLTDPRHARLRTLGDA